MSDERENGMTLQEALDTISVRLRDEILGGAHDEEILQQDAHTLATILGDQRIYKPISLNKSAIRFEEYPKPVINSIRVEIPFSGSEKVAGPVLASAPEADKYGVRFQTIYWRFDIAGLAGETGVEIGVRRGIERIESLLQEANVALALHASNIGWAAEEAIIERKNAIAWHREALEVVKRMTFSE